MVLCSDGRRPSSYRSVQFFNLRFDINYFTKMCSGSEAGSYLRLIDFVYHSTLGLRVIKMIKKGPSSIQTDNMSWLGENAAIITEDMHLC